MTSKSIVKMTAALVFLFEFGADGAPAPTPPLFSRGAETFRIQDKTGKTPQYRVLDDTESERALAVGIITALNSQTNIDPKLPVRDYVDLKVESMTLRPGGDAKTLEMQIKLSGYDLDIPQTIDRGRFLAGQTIAIDFPETERDVSLFRVHSNGRLRMRLDPKTNNVLLEDVLAKMRYESVLVGAGDESLRFSGRGIRQYK